MLFDRHGNPTLGDPAKAQAESRIGENLANGVADIGVAFPEDWMRQLREISPVSDVHSYLIPYWYRKRERWTLYDVLPDAQIPVKGMVGPAFTVEEYWRVMNGPRPSTLKLEDQSPFVSDVQWEMHRVHGGYARPFWVLQGEQGGHQVAFSPWQQNVLMKKGLPTEPPGLGDLPFAPFDGRVARHLTHLNRLHQFENQMDRLRESGSKAAADAQMDALQREIRDAEYDFIVNQMEPIVDMSMSLVRGQNTRAEHDDQIVRVKPGAAAEAADAIQRWKETGDYTLRDLTGTR